MFHLCVVDVDSVASLMASCLSVQLLSVGEWSQLALDLSSRLLSVEGCSQLAAKTSDN